MATRFYLEYGTTPAVTPSAWDSSWNYVTSTFGPYSYTCTTTVQNTTLTDLTHVNDATGTAQLGATARFISAPLAAQTISGTIKGQILCYEASPSNSATIAIAITRINSAGTYQDTLLAASASDAGTTTPPELVVGTATNRSFQDAAESASLSLTSRTFAAGDRLVIEIGVREVRTTSFEYLIVGTNASSGDLPEDTTTTTTTYRPWVEFSATLAFATMIAVGAGATTLTGYAPSLVRGVTLTVPAASVAVTGYAPTLIVAEPPRPGVGALTLTGYAPSVQLGSGSPLRATQVGLEYADAQSATLRATQVGLEYADAQSATLRATQVGVEYADAQSATLRTTQVGFEWAGPGAIDYTLSPAVGSVTFTGLAPTVISGVLRIDPAGSLTLTGAAPTVVQVAFRAPGVGALSLVGYAPTVLTGAVVGVPAGSLSLTGAAPSLQRDFVVEVPAGTLTLTGLAPAQQGIIAVPVGQVGLTGQAPTVVVTRTIAVPAGSLTLTGTTSTVTPGQIIAVPAGTLTLTGAAPDLGRSYVITVPAGSLVLTGEAPGFDAPRTIVVPAGALTLTGTTSAIRETQVLIIPAGSLVLTGPAVYTLISPPLPAAVTATVRPMRRLRRSPFVAADDHWVFHQRFELLLEAGVGLNDGQGEEPQVMVRWSDNGGHTWSDEHWTSAGRMGQYRRRAVWRRLGRSRTRVYEVSLSDPVKVAWISAALDVQAGGS